MAGGLKTATATDRATLATVPSADEPVTVKSVTDEFPSGTDGIVQAAEAGKLPENPSLVDQLRLPVTFGLQVPESEKWGVPAATLEGDAVIWILGALTAGEMNRIRFHV
jgi:hypothetical protein